MREGMISGDAAWKSWLVGLLLFVGIFLGPAAWTAQHAIFFAIAGLIVIVGGSPRFAKEMGWLVAIFILSLLTAFLPASLFSTPAWRKELAGFGIMSVSQVIQRGMAVEMVIVFVLTALVGLWLSGRRFSAETLKNLALAYALGVAGYALLSWLLREPLAQMRGRDHFGFFPNRNHSATYLVMGGITGLGCFIQAVREKRSLAAIAAAVALVVILVGLIFWSESRAGIVLLVLGMVAYAVFAGTQVVGSHTAKALGLVALLGVGLFSVGSSEVKERIVSTITRSSGDDSSNEDFRIPTWQDTLTMIKEAPLSGVGAGQFRFVFPQYRDRTALAQFAESYHPESDWLWIAAESGVPAAIVLLILVGTATVISARKLKEGRGRAVRAACLVAALMIPLHGFFDVPGHRVILAWTGCWLYALSLPPLMEPVPASVPWFRWLPWKSLGLASLAAGIFLGGVAWFGVKPPDVVSADHALKEGELLLRKDERMQADAKARGDAKYDPSEAEDPFEQAYQLLGDATIRAPLDRRLYRDRASFGLHLDDRDAEIDRILATERALAPRRIDIPVRQGKLWAPVDAERTKILWLEAKEVARELDVRLGPDGKFTKDAAKRIKTAAKAYPDLMDFANSMDINRSSIPN